MDGKQLILPDNPTLRDFQDYVAEMKKIRGGNRRTGCCGA